ncbi:MAG: hypothetical protein M0036_07540 [Desulfobacteraceae bacterium]|nr:hypothetical protein [Desulfobacteraceae bacterium]
MKVAFIHYHLKTGGVTSVIKQQVTALHDVCQTMILTGDRGQGSWPCPVVQIPELGYDRLGASAPPEQIAAKIQQTLIDAWPGGCDILHIHNPILAKNKHLLQVIKQLQPAGVNLFLQIHDFAEEGRPGAYFSEAYPQDCHYGVINTRDGRLLIMAGLEPSGVHWLPNAVEPLSVQAGRQPEPMVLYPVRAIRRKNIGEAILLSLFFEDGRRLAITQPPNSPADMASYQGWRQYVSQNKLKVEFDQGRQFDFSVLISSAQSMLTTSITEGFGFSFLEPWTAGKLLWGRRLPGPCADFEANGVLLPTLYDRIDLPLDWLDAKRFHERWRDAVISAAHAYGYTIASDTVEQGFADITQGGVVDFGLLNEYFQRRVISRILEIPAARAQLQTLNPCLIKPGLFAEADALIPNNRRAVARHFNLQSCRQRLWAIYGKVIRHPVRHQVNKKALWEAFFDLNRFSLLQWEAYDER